MNHEPLTLTPHAGDRMADIYQQNRLKVDAFILVVFLSLMVVAIFKVNGSL